MSQSRSWWCGFEDCYEGENNDYHNALSEMWHDDEYLLGWQRAEELLLTEHEMEKQNECKSKAVA